VPHQCGVFGRLAQAWREWHAGGQGVAHLRRHAGHHGRLEDTGSDGHYSNTETRQFTSRGQCEAGDGTFGGGIRSLTDLPIEGGHGSGIDDHAAFTVGIRFGFRNGRSGQA